MKKTMSGVLLAIFAVLILTIGGCNRAGNHFNDNYDQFKKSYLAATEFIEKDKDYRKALATIDHNQMNKEMEEMKEAYDQMGSLLKTEKEKGLHSNVTRYYQEVEFIRNTAKNLNNLTIDEKIELEFNVMSIIRDRERIISGEV